MGYKYKDIVKLLGIYHGVSEEETAKEETAKYNLKKKNVNTDEQELRTIIQQEIEGAGRLAAYRKIWHVLCIKHRIHAPRKVVADIVHDIDIVHLMVHYYRL